MTATTTAESREEGRGSPWGEADCSHRFRTQAGTGAGVGQRKRTSRTASTVTTMSEARDRRQRAGRRLAGCFASCQTEDPPQKDEEGRFPAVRHDVPRPVPRSSEANKSASHEA